MIIDVSDWRWTVDVSDQSTGGFPSETLKLASVVATFFAVVCLEAGNGNCKSSLSCVRQSYYVNFGVFLVNEAASSIIPLQIIAAIAELYSEWGLLWSISNQFARWAWSLVLYDCMPYAWLRTLHRYDCSWGFHRVHHNDRCMNASTSFRIHGVELSLGAILRVLFMIFAGVDSALMATNEAIATICVVLHHANARPSGERLIGLPFVVPSQHRVHRSTRRTEHDRNYGALSSVWDPWFRTLTLTDPTSLGFANVEGLSLGCLLWDGLPARLKESLVAWYAAAVAGWAIGYRFDEVLEIRSTNPRVRHGGGQSADRVDGRRPSPGAKPQRCESSRLGSMMTGG